MHVRVPIFLQTEGQISQGQFHILQIRVRFKECNYKVTLEEREKVTFQNFTLCW
jgi:hypothetical protein